MFCSNHLLVFIVMAKVSEWLGLYMWMNNERLTEIEAKMAGENFPPKDRARILAALQEQRPKIANATGARS